MATATGAGEAPPCTTGVGPCPGGGGGEHGNIVIVYEIGDDRGLSGRERAEPCGGGFAHRRPSQTETDVGRGEVSRHVGVIDVAGECHPAVETGRLQIGAHVVVVHRASDEQQVGVRFLVR